jgi:deoxyhypusine synthase
MSISAFLERHFLHFNAATVVEAAHAYRAAVDDGASMMVTLAGAMSTAQLGRSLAEMIRRDNVHAICCTGANLEEDVFNLVAHDHYKRVPHWRDLTPQDEQKLLDEGYARVTDTCIPEEAAIRKIEHHILALWTNAAATGEHRFAHEYLYELLLSGTLEDEYQIDPQDSWLMAAAQKKLPIFVPGWEDSTLGNIFASHVISGDLPSTAVVKHGCAYMVELATWYEATAGEKRSPGFFQIGGGIAGDFPICVVPMLNYDLKRDVRVWSYFCQISDSTTSYGSYSGAVPNEKITWGKLEPDTPRFVIESDATIVAPLMFAHVMGE